MIDFNKKTKDLSRFEKTFLLACCLLITILVLALAIWVGYQLQSEAFSSKFG